MILISKYYEYLCNYSLLNDQLQKKTIPPFLLKIFEKLKVDQPEFKRKFHVFLITHQSALTQHLLSSVNSQVKQQKTYNKVKKAQAKKMAYDVKNKMDIEAKALYDFLLTLSSQNLVPKDELIKLADKISDTNLRDDFKILMIKLKFSQLTQLTPEILLLLIQQISSIESVSIKDDLVNVFIKFMLSIDYTDNCIPFIVALISLSSEDIKILKEIIQLLQDKDQMQQALSFAEGLVEIYRYFEFDMDDLETFVSEFSKGKVHLDIFRNFVLSLQDIRLKDEFCSYLSSWHLSFKYLPDNKLLSYVKKAREWANYITNEKRRNFQLEKVARKEMIVLRFLEINS